MSNQVLKVNVSNWKYLKVDGLTCRKNEKHQICEAKNHQTGNWQLITDKSFHSRVLVSGSLIEPKRL